MMRIDKLLSDMGIATRRESADAARRGQILVDGVPVKKASQHIDPEKQTVTFRGREIAYTKFTYVMLNKPEGYVSATEDSSLPVVTELLPEELRRREMFPVGRLDRDTVGLMLLTNDGALAHTVLSPRHHVAKEYRFSSAEPMRAGVEDEFRDGVTLADGYECKSAIIRLDDDRLGGVITLTEGKYHQIKRMVASTSNRVTYLERISFAGIPLDPSLSRGEWRYLTDEEIETLRNATED
ncbi:MAG: rRNA pseudouridine synthase [Clostridia bacterium]|nr:rRNA pseudouridine synthase [Clostridia bacterium]